MERLLVGIDRLKDRSILEPAYNDSQGITEAFNKNVLLRINSELGGEFNLDSFALYSRYGFIPRLTYQDMWVPVPEGGLGAPAPGRDRVRPPCDR